MIYLTVIPVLIIIYLIMLISFNSEHKKSIKLAIEELKNLKIRKPKKTRQKVKSNDRKEEEIPGKLYVPESTYEMLKKEKRIKTK